jgi:DNA-binding transcriptional MocR family regulator
METARRSVAVEAALTPALQAGRGKLTVSRTSTKAWLELPEPWRAIEFADAARRAGVLVSPAEAFAVGRTPAPHAVRIAFSNMRTRAVAAEGARRLAELLIDGPSVHTMQDTRT